MRKPAFCICENKDADQLRGNLTENAVFGVSDRVLHKPGCTAKEDS